MTTTKQSDWSAAIHGLLDVLQINDPGRNAPALVRMRVADFGRVVARPEPVQSWGPTCDLAAHELVLDVLSWCGEPVASDTGVHDRLGSTAVEWLASRYEVISSVDLAAMVARNRSASTASHAAEVLVGVLLTRVKGADALAEARGDHPVLFALHAWETATLVNAIHDAGYGDRLPSGSLEAAQRRAMLSASELMDTGKRPAPTPPSIRRFDVEKALLTVLGQLDRLEATAKDIHAIASSARRLL